MRDGESPVGAIEVEDGKAKVDAETYVDCGTFIEEWFEEAISEGA